jgi:hypothetical protein
MKGVVFTEYLEFVEDSFGYDMVDQLMTSCELESGGVYTAVGSYHFTELVQLLIKTCELSKKQPEYLLRKFGVHIFDFFTKAYPQFFTNSQSAIDFLSTLDDKIHPEVLKLYPDAELPKFEIERKEEDMLVMLYRSTRKMSDFAEGLIEACLNHFKEKGRIETEQLDAHGEVVRFTVTKTP